MRKRFSWEITGSRDEIKEILGAMTGFNEEHPDVETRVLFIEIR